MNLTTSQVKKFNRIGNQLLLTERLLQAHPLTQDKWGIVRTLLHYLNAQTNWSSAPNVARLLITLQTAFIGCQSEMSAAGFIGPQLDKFQQAVFQMLATTLPRDAVGSQNLLALYVQLLGICSIFVLTQVLGGIKGQFAKKDHLAAKKGAQLLQELGSIWLLKSHLLEMFLKFIGEALKIDERNLKIVEDVGLFYILILIIILTDEEGELREDLLDTLRHFMVKPLNSVEIALERVIDRGLLDDEMAAKATGHLQTLRLSLEKQEAETTLHAIRSGFEALGLPYVEVRNDVKKLIKTCSQLDQTIKNAFYQAEKSVTSVDQAA